MSEPYWRELHGDEDELEAEYKEVKELKQEEEE
jgi:hypothetical protein